MSASTVLVKCGSHRARAKMLALVGRENAQALFSMRRNTAKGAYRIPAALAQRRLALPRASSPSLRRRRKGGLLPLLSSRRNDGTFRPFPSVRRQAA
jgi:hypothetical protein